jgi:hypothetical protein
VFGVGECNSTLISVMEARYGAHACNHDTWELRPEVQEFRPPYLKKKCFFIFGWGFFVLFCFLVGLEFDSDSGLCACKAGALPLEPHLQSILLWLFWRWGLRNYLPGLVSNLPSNHWPLLLYVFLIWGSYCIAQVSLELLDLSNPLSKVC